MSQIKVNSIVPVNGLPSGANGGIIQVIQTFKDDAESTTSTSFADLNGMSATITPSSSSNKILISFSLCLSSQHNPVTFINLVRGSQNIAQPASAAALSTIQLYSDGDKIMQQGFEFLDSPSTTNSTTYKLQWRTNNSSQTSKLNQYYNQTNFHSSSTITLMEVSA
tara:strand:- start:59 stop:556 length:498 start_codon:yes stop_codon:yes gene_type:complete